MQNVAGGTPRSVPYVPFQRVALIDFVSVRSVRTQKLQLLGSILITLDIWIIQQIVLTKHNR